MNVCVGACACGICVIWLYGCKCLYASSENNPVLNFSIAVSGRFERAMGQEASVCCGWSHHKCCSVIGVIPSGGGDWTSRQADWPHYPILIKYVSHGNIQTHVSYTLQYTTGLTCVLFYCLCAVCMSLVKFKLPSTPNSVHPSRPPSVTLPVKSMGFPLHEVISHDT